MTDLQIDRAIGRLREFDARNSEVLDALRRDLTAPGSFPLVPFIGAGISIPMGFPSWKGFLEKLGETYDLRSQVCCRIEHSEYASAAELIKNHIGARHFDEIIERTFGLKVSNQVQLTGAITMLPRLARGPVITTNVDALLERMFVEAGAAFEEVAYGSQPETVQQAIAKNRRFLLKIHGDASDPTSRVITQSEYDAHYQSDERGGLRAQLERIFKARILFFVGCSLEADYTMKLLLDVLQTVSGVEHFALVESPPVEEESRERATYLESRGIRPIWYPHGCHDLVHPVLAWISTLQPSIELNLEPPSRRRITPQKDLDLLLPQQRSTVFVGRGVELEQLKTWVLSAERVSVRVVIGAGGSGKTRLAVELIEWLESCHGPSWNCGFLTGAELDRFLSLQNFAHWFPSKSTLAVLDYAGSFPSQSLRTALGQIATADQPGRALRLLLLERHASLESGWMGAVLPRSYSAARSRQLFDPPKPVELPPLPTTDDRLELLTSVIQCGAALQCQRAPEVPASGSNQVIEAEISKEQWRDPLVIMMAGLTALSTGLPEAMAMNRTDLALHLAERERERIRSCAGTAPPDLVDHLAAYVTLCGGFPEPELRDVVKTESQVTGMSNDGTWRILANQLLVALGPQRADPVRPDIVGEALLLLVWQRPNLHEGTLTIGRAIARHMAEVTATLIRTAQDFSSVGGGRDEPVVWLNAVLDHSLSNLDCLTAFCSQLPPLSIALGEISRRALEAKAELLQRGAQLPANISDAAKTLLNLGSAYSHLGMKQKALEVVTKAVALLQELYRPDEESSLSLLGNALDSLGNRLAEVSDWAAAFDATLKAFSLISSIPNSCSDAALLARVTENLGSREREQGRPAKAIELSESAIHVYRELGTLYPDQYSYQLARVLQNYAVSLSKLGRRQDALSAVREACELLEPLAARNIDTYGELYAGSLTTLASRLFDAGLSEEALAKAELAVSRLREMERLRPKQFTAHLSTALDVLANRLSDLGAYDAAAPLYEEAIQNYQALVCLGLRSHEADLARCFLNQCRCLNGLGQYSAAVRVGEVAVARYSRLKKLHGTMHDLNLARSFGNVAEAYSNNLQHDKALASIQQCVTINKHNHLSTGDVWNVPLTQSLASMAGIQGKYDVALSARTFREAILALESLFDREPQTCVSMMSRLLNNYVNACRSSNAVVDGDLVRRLRRRMPSSD